MSPHHPTKPYPGYVHGTHPEVCANGCRANPEQHLEDAKDWKATLIREAMEYQDLYHTEFNLSPETRDARKAAILQEITDTGTYELTFDELQHGARVSWRNAPKCANRKCWDQLELLDYRSATGVLPCTTLVSLVLIARIVFEYECSRT